MSNPKAEYMHTYCTSSCCTCCSWMHVNWWNWITLNLATWQLEIKYPNPRLTLSPNQRSKIRLLAFWLPFSAKPGIGYFGWNKLSPFVHWKLVGDKIFQRSPNNSEILVQGVQIFELIWNKLSERSKYFDILGPGGTK